MAAEKRFYATGKRKTAIARVWLKSGSGTVSVNKLGAEDYFGNIGDTKQKVDSPFVVTDTLEKFDVIATLKGGGKSAQVDALRHGISKALLEVDPEYRISLKKAGFLTRDSRIKERKKYGKKGARASFQFSKR
jgi:small subunit ribosomal protein S9